MDNSIDAGIYNPATIGDYVWLDVNNNGIQDADEPGIRGATVKLWDSGHTTVLQTTTTNSSGAYSFSVASGTYILEFAIGGGYPPGKQDQGSDDTLDSDANPTTGLTNAITLTNGQVNNTVDAGFYTQRMDLGDLPSNYPTLFRPGPAHLIFPDTNSDGKPDTAGGVPAVWLGLTIDIESNGQPSTNADGDGADEDGLAFAPGGWIPGYTSVVNITLNGSASAVTVYYGLWIDWNNDGDFIDTDDGFYSGSGVTGSPVVVPVNVLIPSSYVLNNNVYFRARAYDVPLTQADYQGTLVNGEVEDYLRKFGPTAVIIASFIATPQQGSGLLVSWETALETDLVGFNVYRSTSPDGEYTQINPELIPAQAMGSINGSTYTWLDSDTQPDTVYYYKLEVADTSGESTFFGPVTASLSPSLYRIYLPEVSRAEP
jgi:hypothetical protein